MTFRDLQEAIARLADDPRVQPTTPIEVEEGRYDDNIARHIVIKDHTIIIAATRLEPAIVRA